MKIKNIKAREILDSRGNPTIEVDVICSDSIMGRCSVPSGASTGSKEALELRDNDDRYNGKGVCNAVSNVINIIKPKLIGVSVLDQRKIDIIMLKLDNTPNKSKLGANAILGVSIACLKAASKVEGVPLYKYMGNNEVMPVLNMNIMNGGQHANNKLDFQEFMIVPIRDSIKERMRVGSEVFHKLKKILNDNGYSTAVGDEGGFAPNLNCNEDALKLIVFAISEAGYTPGKDVCIALDVAASEFYDKEKNVYNLKGENRILTSLELTNFYVQLIEKYPIISIEDSHDENDWEGFKDITEKLGKRIQLVGDDLFVTNKNLLKKGIDMKACNSILIKFNQVGSVSEALETIKLAKENGYRTMISHRSGETEDVFISDFAVGLELGQIKSGSMSRGERIAKYNRLLRIEEEISSKYI